MVMALAFHTEDPYGVGDVLNTPTVIYLLLFYKLIRGPYRAMHLCIVISTVDASLDGLHISIGISISALLGVGRRGGFSYHSVYTRLMARLNMTFGFVYFYKVSFQHPGLLEKT